MVNSICTYSAVTHINRIYEMGNLFLIRLYKYCEDDEFPMFEFALNGRDDGSNTINIYYIDGTWKMTTFCGVSFDYTLLSFAITPFIRFLNCHGHEIDFNEIRKNFDIEEEEE